ncbi:MAG: universal stress family protein [Proteobacteria bacterium]|nr:MAG: universal stress family protein [Pseudomonadota bacterium]
MLPEYRSILYCTGLADDTSFAALHALSLAKQTNADLHILHVAEPLSREALVTLETYLTGFKNKSEFRKQRVSQAKELIKERLDTIWEKIKTTDPDLRQCVKSIKVSEAHVAEEILNQAKKLDCDLIIMGIHQKGKSRALVGSVSRQVAQLSRVPVLLVPLRGS